MNYRNALETIMDEKKITQTELARLAGLTGQSTIAEAFKRDMKVSLVSRLAGALGYDLVLIKRQRGRKQEGTFVLDDSTYIPKRKKDEK